MCLLRVSLWKSLYIIIIIIDIIAIIIVAVAVVAAVVVAAVFVIAHLIKLDIRCPLET